MALPPAARLLLLTAFASIGSPRGARADAPVALLDVDIERLRASELGEEADFIYATALAFFEGSLSNERAPAVVIRRLRFVATSRTDYVFHLFGRFERGALDVTRALDPEATPRTMRLSLPGFAGLPEITPAQMRICDASHVVISNTTPAEGQCEVGERTPSGSSSFDRFTATHLATAFVDASALPLARGNFRTVLVGASVGPELVADYVISFGDAASVARFRASLAFVSASEEVRDAVRIEEVGHDGPATDLALRVQGDLDNLREISLERLSEAFAGEAPAHGPVPSEPLSPFAELDALRERREHNVPGSWRYESATPGEHLPVVLLGTESFALDIPLRDALLAAGHPTLYYLFPDGPTPSANRVWTRHGVEALTLVRSLLDDAAGPPDPCARGCVLVAGGASGELAVELAVLDPVRFPHVFVQSARRTDALPFLASVQSLSSGTRFNVLPGSTDDDETLAFRAALARLDPHAQRLVDLAPTALAASTRIRAEPSAQARPGRLRAPRVRGASVDVQRALACREGDAEACAHIGRALFAPQPAGSPRITVAEERLAQAALERACALENVEACFEAVGAWPTGSLARAGALEYVCELSHGAACTDLGYAFDVGAGVPQSLEVALDYYAQGCALSNPYGCRNAYAILTSDSVSRISPRLLETSTRAVQAGLREPAMRASVIATCDGGPCFTEEEIVAWVAGVSRGATP